MQISDVWLLWKKVVVGVVITIVPVAILAGGLWLTEKHVSIQTRSQKASSAEVNHAN